MLHLSSLHYYACYYALLCLLHQQQQALSTTIIIDGATTNEWATRDEYQRLVEEARASQQQQHQHQTPRHQQVGDGARDGFRMADSNNGNEGSNDQSIEQIARSSNQAVAVKAAPQTSRLVLGAPVDSEAETATQDVLSVPADSQTPPSMSLNELEGALDKLELIEHQRAAQVQKLNKLKSLERAAEGDVVKAIEHSKSVSASKHSSGFSGGARTISDLVAKGDEGLEGASNLMGRETPRRRCGDELMSLLELYCRGVFYNGEPEVVQPTITKTKRSVDYAEALAAESNGGVSRRRKLRTLQATAAMDADGGFGLLQSDKQNQLTNDGSNNHNQQYLSRGTTKSSYSSRYRGIRGAHKECCERACMVDELKPYCGRV